MGTDPSLRKQQKSCREFQVQQTLYQCAARPKKPGCLKGHLWTSDSTNLYNESSQCKRRLRHILSLAKILPGDIDSDEWNPYDECLPPPCLSISPCSGPLKGKPLKDNTPLPLPPPPPPPPPPVPHPVPPPPARILAAKPLPRRELLLKLLLKLLLLMTLLFPLLVLPLTGREMGGCFPPEPPPTARLRGLPLDEARPLPLLVELPLSVLAGLKRRS